MFWQENCVVFFEKHFRFILYISGFESNAAPSAPAFGRVLTTMSHFCGRSLFSNISLISSLMCGSSKGKRYIPTPPPIQIISGLKSKMRLLK